MLDEKRIKESKNRIEEMLKKNEIIKENSGRYTDFFLTNSRNSFDSAYLLFKVSTNNETQKLVGFSNFNGFLWVINASYYSMFYIVRALLENTGIKIKTDYSLHLLVFDALIYYFYSTGKIERQIIEEFHEAGLDSYEFLGKEKARLMIDDYLYEKEKRMKFTYEMGEIALMNKAKTSIDRARNFNETIRKIIKNI